MRGPYVIRCDESLQSDAPPQCLRTRSVDLNETAIAAHGRAAIERAHVFAQPHEVDVHRGQVPGSFAASPDGCGCSPRLSWRPTASPRVGSKSVLCDNCM